MPALPGIDALSSALAALPPRPARLLTLRLLEGRGAADCARRYGISEQALAVHQLRAARALAQALGWPAGNPAPEEDEEVREARWLEDALGPGRAPGPPPSAGPGALAELLRHVQAEAGPLRAALVAAEEAEARSPRRRREERLRQLAVLLLVALTLYFLLR